MTISQCFCFFSGDGTLCHAELMKARQRDNLCFLGPDHSDPSLCIYSQFFSMLYFRVFFLKHNADNCRWTV